jgi:hypothetical protein
MTFMSWPRDINIILMLDMSPIWLLNGRTLGKAMHRMFAIRNPSIKMA